MLRDCTDDTLPPTCGSVSETCAHLPAGCGMKPSNASSLCSNVNGLHLMLDDCEYADSGCGPLNRRISLEKLPLTPLSHGFSEARTL